VKLSTYQYSEFIGKGFVGAILKNLLIFLDAVFSRANEHFWIGLVGNHVIRAVGRAINEKYCNNMDRKLEMGLTMVLAAAIINKVSQWHVNSV